MSVILGSFRFRGIVQPIRLMLIHSNVRFEERYELIYDDIKPNMPYGMLPYYRDKHDRKLKDYDEILLHIARSYNLEGTTEFEETKIKKASQVAKSMRKKWDELMYGGKLEFVKGMQSYEENLNITLQNLSDGLGDEVWFSGINLSYVDFLIYELFDINEALFQDCLAPFENLKKFKGRLENLPLIQQYMNSDDFIRRPINGPTACFDI